MLKSYRYELCPSADQKKAMDGMFGSVRFIYNLALETKIAAYKKGVNISCFELINQLPDLKRECEWLYNSPSQSLCHAISHLEDAYTNFFKGRSKFPSFKSKKGKQSFHIQQGTKADWTKREVFLPKLKWLKMIVSRKFDGEIRNATVSKTKTGKYFVSILVQDGKDLPEKKPIQRETTIGIDVGLTHFATLSDGTKIDNPRFLQHSLKRLRIEKRTLQRRYKKGAPEQSKGFLKQKLVVAKLYEKIANQRKDFLHKLTTAIVKQFDTIVLEDLNIKGMVQNKNLSRAISDVGWGEFERQIAYKCEWYGNNFLQIGRFEPSSKICSSCGKHKGDLKLSERSWTCVCGITHDRDLNAALNIRNFGIGKTYGVGTHPMGAKVVQ